MSYLLDTCVLSEVTKRKPDSAVINWLRMQDPSSLFISCITIGEIKKGIVKRGGDVRAKRLEQWLERTIFAGYRDRILPVEKDVALEWGRICGEAERIGNHRPAVDAMIAATAAKHHLILVTRNVDDMAGMGVGIFNPFSS